MTYRGERARELPTEQSRVFEVSRARLTADGQVQDVMWREVNTASGLNVGAAVLATSAEVMDAIHDGAGVVALFKTSGSRLRKRPLVVVVRPEGGEHLAFEGPPIQGRELVDLRRFEPLDARSPVNRIPQNHMHSKARARIHAVSKVRLDADGRITAVLWGTVDPSTNDWAAAEAVVPVGVVASALMAGHQVFALFPSTHGHLPERQFVVADYDGNRTTIVLAGPATHEREVHHMDHLGAAD